MYAQAPEYVLDTTVLEDYFYSSNENIKNWINNLLRTDDSDIVITPTVLIELVRRLYYVRQKDAKKVRLSIKLLTNAIRRVQIPSTSKEDVKEITRVISDLPQAPACHVGELSFLHLLDMPNKILVTSDQRVLEVYIMTDRIDPRSNPHVLIRSGEEYRPN